MSRSEKELNITRRAVATARFAEFRSQCERLSTLARTGVVEVTDAVDCLWETAISNSLVRAHEFGDIEQIITAAFTWNAEQESAA